MMIKTHVIISLFFVLLFLPVIDGKIVFVLVTLFATLIPDVDSRFSYIGSKKIMRVLQFFTKHRGIIHSFTFLFLLTLIILLVYPKIAFGFFLGYGMHLFADSFTSEGIEPFRPWKKKTSGPITTGGKSEMVVMMIFLIADLGLLLKFLII